MSICQIYDLCAETLWLGRYGENGARDIAIDVGRWFADLGAEGTVVLVNWRPGEDDTPYNPNVTMDGSKVVWSPSNIDLAISGRGFAELRYYVGNALAKSKTFRTVIDRTPSEGAEPPSAAEDWLERMEDAAVTAQTASETAVTAAETATEGAQAVAEALPTVTQAAQTATSAATTATNAATEAALSEEVASTAANAAQAASETATAASQTAVSASGTATTKAEQAVEAASTATAKASEATQAATTATANAQTSTAKAEEATTAAATATSKATEATTAAATATSAKTDAVAANTAAQSAKTAAQTAQTGAETAAASVSASAAQIATNAEDISQLKSELTAVMPVVADIEASTNLIAFNDYSDASSGITFSVVDGLITISGTATDIKNIYLYYDEYPIVLESGNYVATLDSGLILSNDAVQVIFYNQVLQNGVSQKAFSLSDAVSNNALRIRIASGTTIDWSGHFWINPNTAQEYIPKGETLYTPKTLVEEYQGEENSGKVLAVGTDGNVTLINNDADNTVSKTIYERGNLLDYSEIAKGYIQSNGTVQDYNSLYHSGYVTMYGDTVYCNVVGGSIIKTQYFAFYDANKNLVASYSTIGQMTKVTTSIYKVAVPEGANYFRCSFTDDQSVLRTAWISNICENPYPDDLYSVDDVYPYTSNPSNPCDYSELTVRTFSKAVCIGDSLTYGGFNMDNSSSSTGQTASQAELAQRYSYPTCFQKITGIDTTNKGTSGVTAQQWYTQFQSDDFSEFDLAIIFLGVNDSAQHVSDADTLTAMQNIVTMLNTERSDMRIAICSCIPAYDGTGYQAKGQLILNWAKGLNDPNIIPLDLAQYSHVRPKTSYVAGHCSALGYYMMALDIARYISWYMDHHKRDFRFIQFIGSPDASWSSD